MQAGFEVAHCLCFSTFPFMSISVGVLQLGVSAGIFIYLQLLYLPDGLLHSFVLATLNILLLSDV